MVRKPEPEPATRDERRLVATTWLTTIAVEKIDLACARFQTPVAIECWEGTISTVNVLVVSY